MSENMEGRSLVHSTVEISVDPNYTTAFMSITAPENGGMDMTFEKAMSAIESKNISFGINENAVRDAVENKRYGDNICIARWTAPVDGKDGEIHYLFKTETNIAPVEDEHGVVDFKDLGLVRNITKGTVIATITLPTTGSPGKDIAGKTILQHEGVPAKINLGAGTAMAGETEIIAAIDGNLRYSNNAFCVDEQLVINGDVDTSSGNIDFIGSVIIKGSVFEGFKVTSKKDITINGSVTGAELIADGSISVRIGSINSTINCKGDVKLGFCENSKITADGNVESQSFVGGTVFAGKNIIAGGKGIMVGGKYTALDSIEASIIGSESYAKTVITLGNNALLSEERDTLTRENAEMEDKSEQLLKILNTISELAKQGKLSPEREQLKMDAVRSRLKMQQEIKRNTKRIAEIDQSLELSQNLSVICKRSIYPGVTLRINAYVMTVNQPNARCKATIGNGEIVFVPL